MAANESKIIRKRIMSAYVSSLLSISLVLFLIGVASLLLVNEKNVTDWFKENVQLSVVFSAATPEDKARAFSEELSGKEYVKSLEFVPVEQGKREMEELLGKDFLTVFDTAPIPPSINLNLKADFVTEEKVKGIIQSLSAYPEIDEVVWQKGLIDALNANVRVITSVLGVFIFLLLLISLALLSNMVRTNLYGHRFTVHTMRLVGATKAFIMRPYVVGAAFNGAISAEMALLMLLALLLYVKNEFIQLFTIFGINQFLTVTGIVFAAGVLICVLITAVVVYRMVDLKKDELYG